MTITIPTIVEGQGEVRALPILLRRLGELYFPDCYLKIPPPHRLPRGKIINRPDEFSRAIQLAAAKGQDPTRAFIIVLLDSDDDCPADIGPELAQTAKASRSDFLITISLAVREFESWVLASASTLNGIHDLPQQLPVPDNPESIRNAKGWIKDKRSQKTYSETIDQPKFTSHIDIEVARKSSASFDRFCKKFQIMVDSLILK